MKTLFSNSTAWQLQRDYFNDNGIDAWRKEAVPHYVTSNPMMGKTYAEMVTAMLRDLSSKGNNGETVYILELGAGHGRFCYHFLKYMERMIQEIGDQFPPFCYILSDISEKNRTYWQTHPRLQPFIQNGWLDMALVDAADVTDITLQISGRTITAASLTQPLIVIANYFFDSIPQELFLVKERHLFHCMVETENDTNMPGLQLTYTVGGVAERPYAEPYLASVIDSYRDIEEAYLLFPDTGIRCLHQLQQLSQQGMLLLTADKGAHRKEEVQLNEPPQPVMHGSFSLSVNYHAFKTYCTNSGGMAMFPTQDDFELVVACLLFLKQPAQYKETLSAYHRYVNDFGPDDFFSLKKFFNEQETVMDFRSIMAAIRLSGYDARYFSQTINSLYACCNGISEKDKWMLYQTVHRVWEMYYPLGEANDLAMELGTLLFQLEFYKEAAVYFNLSNTVYGERVEVLYNMGLCYYYANDNKNAQDMLDKIAAKDVLSEQRVVLARLLTTGI